MQKEYAARVCVSSLMSLGVKVVRGCDGGDNAD